MANLKYYEDERKRWRVLWDRRITPVDAAFVIERLCDEYGLAVPPIEWTSGNRSAFANHKRIRLNRDWVNWLNVAHEFAHARDSKQREDEKMRLRAHLPETPHALYTPEMRDIDKRHWHAQQHADMVDEICRFFFSSGLIDGKAPAPQVQKAAQPPSIEQRIAHREAQVKRLERKIKGLTTRLKTARRSLAALHRSQAR